MTDRRAMSAEGVQGARSAQSEQSTRGAQRGKGAGGGTGARAVAALLAALCLCPFAFLAFLSVADGWAWPAVVPAGWTAARWRSVLSASGGLGASFLLSIFISLVAASVATAGGWLAAKHLAGHARRHALLRLAYFPFAMSPVILGACLLHLALRAGLSGGLAGVILAQTIFCWGFAIVFFEGFWSAELRSLEELVRSLGGGTGALYRRVLIPLSRDVLLIGFFQTFLISWFQYGLTLLIGAGKVQTLTLRVYALVGEANPQYAAVASCLLVAPPALLLLVNRRFLLKAV